MTRCRVHVLFESSSDGRPYASSHIRLLRPLTHPALHHAVQLSSGPALAAEEVDIVIVDRLWRSDVTLDGAAALIEEIRQRGARLLYSLDDNLLALKGERKDFDLTQARQDVLMAFLQHADLVVVSTDRLRDVIRPFSRNTLVIPNYLDERLLAGGRDRARGSVHIDSGVLRRQAGRMTIGYMGTRTHDVDLRMIAPALRNVCNRHDGRVAVELVGVMTRSETLSLLHGLPCRVIEPGAVYTEYPAFLPWFVATCRWDIALAPLADTELNRCKSDIKFLDYAALGAAGLYSRVPAYAETVQHGITGLLVDENPDAWEDAIEHLIARPARAMAMGALAQRYLFGRRVLAATPGARAWLDALTICHTGSE